MAAHNAIALYSRGLTRQIRQLACLAEAKGATQGAPLRLEVVLYLPSFASYILREPFLLIIIATAFDSLNPEHATTRRNAVN